MSSIQYHDATDLADKENHAHQQFLHISRQNDRLSRLSDLQTSPRRCRPLRPSSHSRGVPNPILQNIENTPLPSTNTSSVVLPILPTPPATALTRAQISQRARRQREKENQHRPVPQPQSPINLGENLHPLTNAQISQRIRRQREREQRTQRVPFQLPSPLLSDSSSDEDDDCLLRRERRARHTRPLLSIARGCYEEPRTRHDLGGLNIQCSHCDALHWDAEKISTSTRTNKKFGICCNHGKVKICLPDDPPALIQHLLIDDTTDTRNFREHIRQYNSALAFTSVGFQPDRSVTERSGVYVFRIHGELYHLSGAITPSEGHQPRYAQLYVYDPRLALDQRMARNPQLDRNLMESLQTMLAENHFYAGFYQHSFQFLEEHRDVDELTIALRAERSRDPRRYNLPVIDEVAVILPGDGSEPVQNRDIVLRLRDGPLQRVSDSHPAYAALHYVIAFPRGEDGWSWDLRLVDNDRDHPARLTLTAYQAYLLQQRPRRFCTILRCGRLFQQYVVDMWAQAEQNNLNYVRTHQQRIRVDLYNGFADAVQAGDYDNLGALGQRIILPSSFVGSPRYMQQLYQDAMAAARYYKKIDLFVTMTANPKWPEITNALYPAQSASDRPDLVTRVFQLKRKAVIDDICKNGVFGHVVSYVYSIEFQKHGLPHMHLLVFLERASKLFDPHDIDAAICAKWPDPETQPKLFDTVKKCMVHGPCGILDPNAPCMENGICTKSFPKEFQDETRLDEDGYPLYHRPHDDRSYNVHGHDVDNRWIVPYNPYLAAKYDCHINVECATSFASIKYVHKYIYKGHDRTTLEIDHDNEVKCYIDSRYISPPEGMWRIYHLELHKQFPNVVRLHIHLPGQHMVTYDSDDEANEVLERASHEKSTLTAFFRICDQDDYAGELARQYTYQEFPQHFVWKKTQKKWSVRKKGFALGRMYYVAPTAGERFYLRTLLCVVHGPRSFQHLRTVNGVTHPTFHAACLALGLLEDDSEWRICLGEATEIQPGTQCRRLFCTILLFCEPSQPDALWYEFRDRICDDLCYRLQTLGYMQPSQEDVFDYGLYLLEKLLRDAGHGLDDFPSMPKSQHAWDDLCLNRLIADQLNYEPAHEANCYAECSTMLNLEQRNVVDTIFQSIEQEEGQLFFLHGPAGTGKTFVYNTLCHNIRSHGWIVLCVASSGIAALLLIGGCTSHSMFKIPIDNLTDQSSCPICAETQLADLIRNVRAIVWDEITMQHRNGPEAVDRTCQDIRRNTRPFGGITVIFGGDFQQILPVVVRGSREQIVAASLQRSMIWLDMTVLHLRQNMRLESDGHSGDFARWLLDVGHGRNTSADRNIKIPEDMQVDNLDNLINFVYPGINSYPTPPSQYFQHRIILSARNDDVEDLNNQVLQQLSGESLTFLSSDSIVCERGADDDSDETPAYPPEFLRSLNANGLPPGELHLKIGCPLILLRNLAPTDGLCNGTRMILLRASVHVLEVKIMGGNHDGETAFIPRISLTPSTNQTRFNFALRRRQFPVRLAFAMTINKAQGQSVRYVGLDLRIPVFTHGQLYVALSRATSGQRVKVLLQDNSDTSNVETTNIVYPEVLID